MDRKRDRGRIVLVAVLGLSLLGNALTVGAVLRFQSVRQDLLGPASETAFFEGGTRRDIRAALEENGATLRPALRRAAEARAAVVAAGTARPFDAEATRAAMDRFRAEVDGLLVLVQGVVLERLEARAASE